MRRASMDRTEYPAFTKRDRILVALLAGILVFALLFQWGGGIDTDPPTCIGMFGWWTVPCAGWPAVAAGAVTAGLVWLLLGWSDRRRR
jgi:hypothetical protein